MRLFELCRSSATLALFKRNRSAHCAETIDEHSDLGILSAIAGAREFCRDGVQIFNAGMFTPRLTGEGSMR
jgi:hypothetical protein